MTAAASQYTPELLHDMAVRNCKHAQPCTVPECGVMLRGRCHPTAGVVVGYFWSDRVLLVECLECGAGVARIALRPAPVGKRRMRR